jgi:hypothetical protein
MGIYMFAILNRVLREPDIGDPSIGDPNVGDPVNGVPNNGDPDIGVADSGIPSRLGPQYMLGFPKMLGDPNI